MFFKYTFFFLFPLSCLLLMAPQESHAQGLVPPVASPSVAPLGEEGFAYGEVEEIWDPFEGFNRSMFWFNDKLDVYFLEPVAKGYDYVMPEFGQERVRNFFDTIGYPKYLISDLIQLKFGQMANHTGRFLVNATFGLCGLFDVATDMGLPKHEEDIGAALAYQGVPAGPYLVLPLLGPMTFRDGFGRVGDALLDPVYWAAAETADSKDAVLIGAAKTAVSVVQSRADLIDGIDAAKEASLDYYLFAQGAYYQYRAGLVYDGKVKDLTEPSPSPAVPGTGSGADQEAGSFEDPF